MVPSLKTEAASWFKHFQELLITRLEEIEKDYCEKRGIPCAAFEYKPWSRHAEDAQALPTSRDEQLQSGGGGTAAVLKGALFEKAGVNFSEVHGRLHPEFAKQIPGAEEDPTFWASGVSVVIHPRSPLLPTAHMNTRMIVTGQSWFGGGADLTPIYPNDTDTTDFHQAFRTCCDQYDATYYPRYKKWADEYFFLPHRNEPRGVGGIFYDYLNSGDLEKDLAFSKEVGLTFATIYPEIIRRHMEESWTPEQRAYQLMRRGRYVEFNLLYDRGTLFGLKTGGHTESILMSLPPVVEWP